MTRTSAAIAALLLTGALTLSGCVGSAADSDPTESAQPSESAEPSQSAEQANCEAADGFLPTLQAAQEGVLTDDERSEAAADFSALLNDKLVDDDGGQVSAMLFVLAASLRDDASADDKSKVTFDDFHEQLVEYCEGFAGWDMQN